jgi:hypothetical protein
MLASFGRITSDITGGAKIEELTRRAHQREALVSALQQQVLEKEAKKMITRLQRWDEDQKELVLLGFAGAGKPRPAVPEELVPYIQALAPDALNPPPLPAAPAAAASAAAAAPSGAAAALTSRAPLLPAVAVARPVPLPGAPPPPPAGDGPEAHLDRVLRSMAPGLAEHVAAVVETASTAAVERAAQEAAAAAAARVQQAAGGGSGGADGSAGVAALAELVRELLNEQRSIRAQLEARSGISGGGSQRGAPAGSAAALLRAVRGGGGGGRAAPPRAPSPPPNVSSRRGSAARSEDFEGDAGGGGVGSLRRAPQLAKRPPFGRHAEGTLTAAERRAKGDKRLRDAAERRRLALEDFRAASAATKAAKLRETAAQKGLRRQMAFDRQGALAAAEGAFHEEWEGGLADVLRSSPPRSRFTDVAARGGGGGRGGAGGSGGAQYELPLQQPARGIRPSLPPSLQSQQQHHVLADEDMDLASMLGHMPVELPTSNRMLAPAASRTARSH